MKKLLLFAAATLAAFVSCSKDTTQDIAPVVVPDKLYVSIAEDESRMQLSDEKTVWTEDDKVSVFYKSDANQCWKFDGKTGDRSGTLSCISQGTATTQMEKVVVVYPYSESYKITPSSGNIEAKLPAVQKYQQGSYGLESSPMISSGYYTQFALKNICGWLKLQLSGTGTITKITLKGNNGEQLAGDMYINADDATVTLASASVDNDDNQETGGTLVFEDSIVREVVLDCADGVELNETDAVPFYIALPPTVFEHGFTATFHFDGGMQKEISTSKRVEITRNHIVPMEKIDSIVPAIPDNQIWYTSEDGNIVEPFKTDGFGANIISNTYENGKGVITFDGRVTTIDHGAFADCSSLTSITIPDSVTTIRQYAFYGCSNLSCFMSKYSSSDKRCLIMDGKLIAFAPSGLTEYVIPDGVTTIGYGAFSGCRRLTSINIPDSVTTIGDYAFYNCSSLSCFTGKYSSSDKRCLIINGRLIAFAPSGLTEYVIPDGVTSIGVGAFLNCSSLTSITIPDSVTTIGVGAFLNCSSLTSITIPDSVTTIGDEAFCYCSNLTSITIGNGVTTIDYQAFSFCSSLTSITIPDSVTTIGYYAFLNCSSLSCFTGKYSSSDKRCLIMDGTLIAFAPYGLTEYVIPDSVTTIGNYAFYNCSSLTSITIPDSVTSIRYYAFYKCNSLTSINIPDGVTTIVDDAFSNCSSLTSVTIGNGVTAIGSYAFYGCSNLSSVFIGDVAKWCAINFDSYSSNPLCYAKNLYLNGELVTDLVIPDSVTSIGHYAFYKCNSLTSITIPDSVTAIGDYALAGCSSLTSIYCKPITPPALGTNAFYGIYSSAKIYVPTASVDAYKSAIEWSGYASKIVGYDF